jgi:stage II sporulation protein M
MSDFPRYAIVTIIIFAASLAAGVTITITSPETGQQLLDLLKEAIFGDVIDKTAPVLAVTLFFNNLQACTFMFLGGASFGLLTAFIILSNGVIIGAVMELVRQQQGIWYIAAAILPHGVFEISAFVISGTLGFLLARDLWLEVTGTGDAAQKALAWGRIFLLYVIPLVAVAAMTEAFITPEIINLVA